MAGIVRTSKDEGAPKLTSSIEPSTAGKGSAGDVAFKDAVSLVVLCWALLILLMWSLRHHII